MLPFEVFFVLWTVASIAVLYWLVKPWPWALLILFLPWTYELFVGQVHLFIAAAIVLGFRWPSLWAFNILTKVTPGVGLLWFLVRREWRPLAIALGPPRRSRPCPSCSPRPPGSTGTPSCAAARGSGELLYPRIALAAIIVVIGALTDRRWTIPVAVWLALPVVWIESWVILLAIIRLRERPAPVPDPTPAALPANAPV